MWYKETPKVTFSDWANKDLVHRAPKQIKQQFVDMPNYELSGRSFDVSHLDRFINTHSRHLGPSENHPDVSNYGGATQQSNNFGAVR